MENTITIPDVILHAMRNECNSDKSSKTTEELKRNLKKVARIATHTQGMVDTANESTKDSLNNNSVVDNYVREWDVGSGSAKEFNKARRMYLAANKTDKKDIGYNGHRYEIIEETVGKGPNSKTVTTLYEDDVKVPKDKARAIISQITLYAATEYPDYYGSNSQSKLRPSVKHSVIPDELYAAMQNRFKNTDDTIEHHGILGQKWGIRRYQNEDGTLTPQGKKRYLFTRVDVDQKGEPKVTAYGDADRRRMDLEKQNERDAIKTLWGNTAFRLGNYLGLGGAATTASLGLIGGMGLANPAVAAAGMGGSAILGALGYNVGNKVAKKQTGLDDEDKWTANNLKKYALNTSNLGYDVQWKSRSDLARIKNQSHKRDRIDEIWEND